MIIPERKTIFVHIPKNAGTSVKNFLTENKVPRVNKHKTIHDIKRENPEEYNSYKKFAVVRNPYERMVSWYAYINGYRVSRGVKVKPSVDGFKLFVKNGDRGLDKDDGSSLLDSQCCWVDETVTILKYENLSEELDEFFGEKIYLQVLNKTVRDNVSVYYNKKYLDIVYNRYKEDFKKFNYERIEKL